MENNNEEKESESESDRTESKKENKNEEYEDRIVNMLSEKPLSLTELSHAMGYKGITSKLKKTVGSMIERKILAVILGENNKPKIRVNK